MTFLKYVSVVSDIIGILALSLIFIMSFNTTCFKLSEWYLSLSPILISYIAQILSIISGDEE